MAVLMGSCPRRGDGNPSRTPALPKASENLAEAAENISPSNADNLADLGLNGGIRLREAHASGEDNLGGRCRPKTRRSVERWDMMLAARSIARPFAERTGAVGTTSSNRVRRNRESE
ncbi:hypothetical protein IOD13_13810 [Brevibacterium casei]|nr:hypothetical protein [Brevibacterium casei]